MTLRTTPGILARIVRHKATELSDLRTNAHELERLAFERITERRSFVRALKAKQPAIIAEVKKASPSKGLFQPTFDPEAIARAYKQGGAACVSVLTDAKYFQGSLSDLQASRRAVDLPVLRKDFTIDRLQIFESAAYGADAILLIAAVLAPPELREFRELAGELSMAALVEVHNEAELGMALDSGAEIIGINNRDLDTFEVSLETSLRLSEHIPNHVLRVSESGIATRSDVELLLGAGFHAFLVGESLMKSRDPAASLAALLTKAA